MPSAMALGTPMIADNQRIQRLAIQVIIEDFRGFMSVIAQQRHGLLLEEKSGDCTQGAQEGFPAEQHIDRDDDRHEHIQQRRSEVGNAGQIGGDIFYGQIRGQVFVNLLHLFLHVESFQQAAGMRPFLQHRECVFIIGRDRFDKIHQPLHQSGRGERQYQAEQDREHQIDDQYRKGAGVCVDETRFGTGKQTFQLRGGRIQQKGQTKADHERRQNIQQAQRRAPDIAEVVKRFINRDHSYRKYKRADPLFQPIQSFHYRAEIRVPPFRIRRTP